MKASKVFRWAVVLTLLALLAEFVLGMYTALFVEFPDSLVNGNAWGWTMSSSPVITAHVYVGTLLVLLGLVALGAGIASKRSNAIVTGALGLILILGGGFLLLIFSINAPRFPK